ncbi:hypothetical protein CCR75_004263 [Bremia lactucae]|uniref:HIT-type domain-containing protein n=1 Tax=Bremia lactucae TaxID=4779 RepID=A0A976IJT3_BRELC|nr:hypothetical protein CCR75_004263 [Bremia lactucae]
MKLLPIRLGTVRTSVKPSVNVSVSHLPAECPSISNASLVRVCRVCTTREARYTCPRCNIPYCSVGCYAPHGQDCTEQFYENHVRNEMQLSSKAREKDTGKQEKNIQELLKRVQEFHNKHQQLTNGQNNEEALALRMQELVVLEKSGQLTLESLTLEERKKFLGEVADGRLGKLVELWSPWWLVDDRKYRNGTSVRRHQLIFEEIDRDKIEYESIGVKPSVLYPVGLFTTSDAQHLPTNISTLLPHGKQPSPCLGYHLIEMLWTYALVLRYFNGDYKQDTTEAAFLLLDYCRVLSEDARYESLEHVCFACLEKQNTEGFNANLVALEDTQHILRSNVFLLDAISDIQALLQQCLQELARGGKAPKEGKAALKKLAAVQKKVTFYLTWAYHTPIEDFQALAVEIEVYRNDRKLLHARN